MIDGCQHPGQTQTKEDVDGVASGDVSDRVVGRLLHGSRLLRREQIGQTRSERDERDGGHFRFEAGQTSEDGGHVADEEREHADHGERADEREPAAHVVRRRHDGEDDLQHQHCVTCVLYHRSTCVLATSARVP